jgi:hypothetical protein
VVAFRVCLTVLALVFASASAQAETIKNAAYRFTISKPNGWHDMPSSSSQLPSGTVLAFAKYKEPTDELNTSVIMIGIKVGPAAASVPPTRPLYGAIDGVMKTGAKTSVLSPPKDMKLGGLPAAHASVAVELSHKGQIYQSQTDMWAVVRGESVLLIQAQGSRSDRKAGLDKVTAAVKSIRFER